LDDEYWRDGRRRYVGLYLHHPEAPEGEMTLRLLYDLKHHKGMVDDDRLLDPSSSAFAREYAGLWEHDGEPLIALRPNLAEFQPALTLSSPDGVLVKMLPEERGAADPPSKPPVVLMTELHRQLDEEYRYAAIYVPGETVNDAHELSMLYHLPTHRGWFDEFGKSTSHWAAFAEDYWVFAHPNAGPEHTVVAKRIYDLPATLDSQSLSLLPRERDLRISQMMPMLEPAIEFQGW
jgi:hypothetical protein